MSGKPVGSSAARQFIEEVKPEGLHLGHITSQPVSMKSGRRNSQRRSVQGGGY